MPLVRYWRVIHRQCKTQRCCGTPLGGTWQSNATHGERTVHSETRPRILKRILSIATAEGRHTSRFKGLSRSKAPSHSHLGRLSKEPDVGLVSVCQVIILAIADKVVAAGVAS